MLYFQIFVKPVIFRIGQYVSLCSRSNDQYSDILAQVPKNLFNKHSACSGVHKQRSWVLECTSSKKVEHGLVVDTDNDTNFKLPTYRCALDSYNANLWPGINAYQRGERVPKNIRICIFTNVITLVKAQYPHNAHAILKLFLLKKLQNIMITRGKMKS